MTRGGGDAEEGAGVTSTAASAFANGRGGTDWERMWANGIDAVSYTHLTLPTKLEV